MTRLGNTGKEFAIGTVGDFLNIESSVCDAATQSLSWYSTYPVSVVSRDCWPAKAGSAYAFLDMIRPANNIYNAWTTWAATISIGSRALSFSDPYFYFLSGAPAGFQARVGKHLFDNIRRETPKKIFRLPTLVFSLSTLPYVTVAHPAHRSTLVLT